MLKILIDRLLGRRSPVQPEPRQDRATARSTEIQGPANEPANAENPAAEPARRAAGTVSRANILSSYAPVNLADNPLAIREIRRTGAITRVPQPEGWRINPSASFPLTVVGTDEETARQVREALDGLVNHHSEDVAEVVASLMVEHGARFYEFEEYLREQRQIYCSALTAARIRQDGGRRKQSGMDEDDDAQIEAMEALDTCCQDLEMLIDGEYPTAPAELAALRRLGYGNLMRYLGTGPDTAKIVLQGHRKQPGFDALVRAGLAIPGSELSAIPTRALLHVMTARELQSLSLHPIPSKLRKKDLAVGFLLDQDGIRERAIAATAVDALYYSVPVPSVLSGLDLGGMHERMSFAWAAASLVVTTYLVAALAPTNREYEGKHLAAERFKMHSICDILTCRTCKKAHGRSRPLAEWNLFPLHFGCRCNLLLDHD